MNLLGLGRNPLAHASRTALRRERPRERPQVISAAVATERVDRARFVRNACGRHVAARSVVVSVYRRAYDGAPNNSASLAQGTVVVGRFKSGWRIWEVLH